MQSILPQEGGGATRVHLYCMTHQPCGCLDWPTTLILRMVPQRRKAKRKQSARDLSLRHPSLPRADFYEYDEVVEITQVDPREAERFEEGLDLEYHRIREPTCSGNI